jgi:phosphoserine phosphatase RsbU/P
MEEATTRSGADWTILRLSQLTSGPWTGPTARLSSSWARRLRHGPHPTKSKRFSAGLDLAATRAAMDQAIAGQFGGERFVTGQLGQLHWGTGRLQWVNAGHPLPLLVRRAKVVGDPGRQPAPPLGLGLGEAEIATAALEPADRVLFYTDGVTEGRNLAGEPFGETRLADLVVRETLAGQSAAETMRRLGHAILAHQGAKPRDDATMVFLEWPGPPGALARRGGRDTRQ